MKFIKTFFLMIAAITMIFARTVFAQQQLKYSDEPMGWSDIFSIGAGYHYSKTDIVEKTITYEVGYSTSYPETWDLLMQVSGGYSKTKEEMTRNDHKMELETDRWIAHSMWAFNFIGKIETNEVQQIYYTLTTGLGIKFQPVKVWWTTFNISSTPSYEKQRQWNMTSDTQKIRLLNKAELKFFFSKEDPSSRSLLFSITHEPNVRKFNDYKREFEAALDLKIIGNLMWESKFTHTFIKYPVEETAESNGGQKRTYTISSGLKLTISPY